MDKVRFFDGARAINGTLSQRQVDTLNAILDEADKRQVKNEWLAYILATAQGEASLDYAKRENMNYSAANIRKVQEKSQRWRDRIPAHEIEYFVRQPTKLANRVYHSILGNGNESSGDGWTYRGAGLSQITGRDNYAKWGIADNPSLATDKAKSVEILFDGMIAGRFTGKKLADYDVPGGYDFVNARRIINGMASAEWFATWAQRYIDALEDAGRSVGVVAVHEPAPVPSAAPGGMWAMIVRILGSKG